MEYGYERRRAGVTEDDRAAIFPMPYITCVSETEMLKTFSLPQNFDGERFAQRFFDVEKIMDRQHCD